MAVGYANIFPLENAEGYTCSLYSYEISHSGMYIRVSHDEEPSFYLYFADVKYFCGPTSWQGAGFRLIKKPDDYLRVLEAIGGFSRWPREFLLERTQIYAIDTPDLNIKLVAGEIERIDNLVVNKPI